MLTIMVYFPEQYLQLLNFIPIIPTQVNIMNRGLSTGVHCVYQNQFLGNWIWS
jgi:hypothetical protein